MVTTDSVHDLIHMGRLFSACAIDLATANDGAINYLIQAGAQTHLTFEVEGDTAMHVELYAGTTFSNAGTAVAVHNRSLGSSKVPSAVVTVGPTITGNGTLKCARRSGSAVASGHIGGMVRAANEWVIPAGTTALIRVISKSGASASLNSSWEINFYEV